MVVRGSSLVMMSKRTSLSLLCAGGVPSLVVVWALSVFAVDWLLSKCDVERAPLSLYTVASLDLCCRALLEFLEGTRVSS